MQRKFTQQRFERILELSLQAKEDSKSEQNFSEIEEEDHFLEEELFKAAAEEGVSRNLVEGAIRVAALEEELRPQEQELKTYCKLILLK